MKINLVCQKTGLTERTVRYYIEMGLLQTQSQIINGRTNIEFSEEDIGILTDIAKLRKAGFTIKDIRDMQNSSENIHDIILQHCMKLEEEQAFQGEVLEDLKEILKRGDIPWRKVASILFRTKPDYTNETMRPLFEEVDVTAAPPNRFRKYVKRIIGGGIAVCLFILFYLATTTLKRDREPVTHSFHLLNVMIEDKWIDENSRQAYASIYVPSPENTSYENYFEFPRVVKLGTGDPYANSFYDAIQVDSNLYQSVHIWIEVPYGDAKKLNLISTDKFGTNFTSEGIEKLLSDRALIEKYATIIHITYPASGKSWH